MQTCNRYNDYFNCAEHCAGYHASETASDDLPAYMYADDSSSSELVNPWDAPRNEVPLGFVPSGVAAWQPVAVTAYSVRLEEQYQSRNHNQGLAALERDYPTMPGDDFDLEFPTMPMAAHAELLALDMEYPAMPMIPGAHENVHQQTNALELEFAPLPGDAYPPMPVDAAMPLLPPGLGLETRYLPALAQPMHGLAASAWTPTAAERTVDARIVPPAPAPPRRVVVPARVAGLGFALSDLLELRLCETALREFRAARELACAEAEETSDDDSGSSLETDAFDMDMDSEMEMEMEIDDEYVYYTIKDSA